MKKKNIFSKKKNSLRFIYFKNRKYKKEFFLHVFNIVVILRINA